MKSSNPKKAGPGAVVVDDELSVQGFDHSIIVYEDNWLRSDATNLFDQYHELLTEQENHYCDSVLEQY